jgi:hypothetical protein
MRHKGCGEDVHRVIGFLGWFSILSLLAAVGLIGYSLSAGKEIDSTVLIALLVTPMVNAVNGMMNLVTQSNTAQSGNAAGTQSDPVVTTVSQPANDPIPVINEPKE